MSSTAVRSVYSTPPSSASSLPKKTGKKSTTPSSSDSLQTRIVDTWNQTKLRSNEALLSKSMDHTCTSVEVGALLIDAVRIGVAAATYLGLLARSLKTYTTSMKIIRFIFTPIALSVGTIQNLLGLYKTISFRNKLKSIQIEKNDPHSKRSVQKLCLTQIKEIRREFLTLSPSERRKVRDEITKSYPHLSSKEQLEKKRSIRKVLLADKKQALKARLSPEIVKVFEAKGKGWEKELRSHSSTTRSQTAKRVYSFLDEWDMQTKKALFIRTFALFVIAVTAIAFALTFCIAPGPAFLLFATLVTVVSVQEYILSNGVLQSRGWALEPIKLIPSSIRKAGTKFLDYVNGKGETLKTA